MTRTSNLKIIFTFIIVLLFNSCENNTAFETTVTQDSPHSISLDEARSIVRSIAWSDNFSKQGRNTATKKSIKEILPVIDENSETVFYIMNYEAGGFVILSADNRISPIMAYSDTGYFRITGDRYSSGLVSWLAAQKDYIKHIRQKNEAQSQEMKQQWERVTLPHQPTSRRSGRVDPIDPSSCEDSYEVAGPLLTTTWHQSCGFNDGMPVLGCSSQPCYLNTSAYAGCVPIAIGQVMRYYHHPTSYNWTNMPNTIGTSTTANFIRDIWDAIPSSEKSYDCDGTGVDTHYDVAGLFTSLFNYSSASNGSYDYATVEQQLRSNRPVILSGGRDAGWWIFHNYEDGHMWVCDGFRDSFIWSEDCSMGWGYLSFHMNWGWGGSENGWYSFNNFNPGSYTFNYDRQMVYNIVP